MAQPDVLIIGAGLAGISCARHLHKAGVSFHIVEASDAVGGRIRTDRVDGFLLDRGFQVLLTSYPEALENLDYERLGLAPFDSGAMVRYHGEFYRVVDPWRVRGHVISNLLNPIGTTMDKIRIARLRSHVLKMPLEKIMLAEETTTLQALARRKFSRRMNERFFRPFLGGIFLDTKLSVSSRWFEYVFRMFAVGEAALPANGMQAIPEQLAESLPEGSIQFNRRVETIDGNKVVFADGEWLRPEVIVVAVEGPEAGRLLGYEKPVLSRECVCYYFTAKEPPVREPILLLSGSTRGPINNVAVLDVVQPGYAPSGESLISVTIVGNPSRDEDTLRKMVRGQLKRWFGLVVQEWKLLRLYRIQHALPVIYPMERSQPARIRPGVYAAGDHRATPSIQGAMESGRRAAETLLADAKSPR
jgi:phytoene dehydrogenase-like protein